MINYHYRKGILTFLLLFISLQVLGQLTTTVNSNAQQLAQQLVGPGVVISNATLTCPQGFAGTFTATGTNLNISNGVILASGNISNAIGPNVQPGITTSGSAPGDAQLTALAGQSTHDACVLEFDVYVIADTLKFNYVFGSDEYPEYVNSINDIFAFFISGPGITGTQNIALVPGTTTPVAINTVNNGNTFTCTATLPGPCTNCAFYVNNCNGTTIEYDGFTTVLTATAVVQPCQTYHLKLAISDASDDILDSGVFIEAGSLVSTGVTLETSTDVGFGFPYAIEGCNDGIFTFSIQQPDTADLVVHFNIGGTAINGTDYTMIPDSIIIPVGQTSASINITPTVDGITEGLESVIIFLTDPCFGNPIDSAIIEINDYIVPITSNDTIICEGESLQLNSSGGVKYTWTPTGLVDNDTVPNPIVTPTTTTDFIVKMEVGNCVEFDTVTIAVIPAPVITGLIDTGFCIGGQVQLNASGGGTYSWSPSSGLSNPNIPNPIASQQYTTTYTVTVTNQYNCKSTESVTVNVYPFPQVTTSATDSICAGKSAQLSATGAETYIWSPGTGLDDPNIPDPLASPSTTTTYTVIGTDEHGCSDTATTTVTVFPIPNVFAGDDQTINIGESANINATTSGNIYEWTPTLFLNDPGSLTPVATPDSTTLYVLSVTGSNGCMATDSVLIIVLIDGQVQIPNAFSPNGDGINDLLDIKAIGSVKVINFMVFNRWGQVVFETTSDDILSKDNNATSGWDGTFNGEDQPNGTYAYVFVGEDAMKKQIILSGNITLIR